MAPDRRSRARLDEDGFLHIAGRIKEIVIRGGGNISPIEIENVAYRHPAVKEVAVFGLADDVTGEELAMVCHPRLEATLTETPLPRSASEKIHRLALRRSHEAR
jgi:long-chain acyl-CoA synthetase